MQNDFASDQQIGKNLARQRGNMSQKDLADRIRALDPERFKWAPATVWNVEEGKRPLRLGEAEALAEILGCDVSDLLSRSDTQLPKSLFKMFAETVESDEISRATNVLAQRMILTAQAADELRERGVEISESDDKRIRVVTQHRSPGHMTMGAEIAARALVTRENIPRGHYVQQTLDQLKAECDALDEVAYDVF